jgi:hypothetical protein
MKKITSIQINQSDMSAAAQSRSFTIIGEPDSYFSIEVKTSGNKYYNFSTGVFGSAGVYSSNHRLSNVRIVGSSYKGSINIPADSDGETYSFFVYAEPHFETEFEEGVVGSYFSSGVLVDDSYNRFLYRVDIKQIADTTVTIKPVPRVLTVYTSTSTDASVTATQSPVSTDSQSVDFSFVVENRDDDARAFGLQLLKNTVTDSDFYIKTTGTIDHAGKDASATFTKYNVESIDNLGVGMTIDSAVTSGGSIRAVAGTPVIMAAEKYPQTDVDFPGTPFIEITPAIAFADNDVLTFFASGSDNIRNASGMDVSFENLKIEVHTPSTTTVRGAISSSTTVTVNGTYGIGKVAVGEGESGIASTYIEGFGVNNTSDNPITGVSASSSAGSITTTVAQTLADKTKLTIVNQAKAYTISGRVNINKFPASNTQINLNLDNLLLVGSAS